MPRGSAPGERRGGRQPGTPNKATEEIKAIAREYGPDAIEQLAHLMHHAKSEQARISAAKEILDRSYGKATQPVESTQQISHAEQLREIEKQIGLFHEDLADAEH
ncbi:MAG: hypothetical protein ACERJ2_11295 [Filomicrobium sp.]